MRFLDFFRANRPKTSASIAKERLQIIVAQQRVQGGAPDFIPRLQKDILQVIRKYVRVDDDAVDIQFGAEDGYEVLELNITLPESRGAVSPIS